MEREAHKKLMIDLFGKTEEEIAEITSDIKILLERFKKAKRDKMFGVIRFNYTTVDVNELAALKFYEEEVVDKQSTTFFVYIYGSAQS